MEISTPRQATPSKRLVIPHYEDSPRAFGGRGTLSHLAAPSSKTPMVQERRMPSARSFSPNYRSRTPVLFPRRASVSRPGTADRIRTPTLARILKRPSTADTALRDVSRPTGNRPRTADRATRLGSGSTSRLSSQESTSYSKAGHPLDSVKENLRRRPRTTSPENSRARSTSASGYPTLGVSRPVSSRRSKEKNALHHTVPVGSLIQAKATNTLQVCKKGIIEVIKDYNSIKEEADRKQILFDILEGTNKELERHAAYTAKSADPDNAGKVKAKHISKELANARKRWKDLGIFHFQLEFVKKRIEKCVIQSKQNVDHLTNILMGASSCKTEIDLECRSVKDQRHLAVSSVKDVRARKNQKSKSHTLEIAALKKVIENQKRWAQYESAWRKRETERPKLNSKKGSQSTVNLGQASYLEKMIAQKLEKLVIKIGLDEEDIFDYILDYPNKLQEFENLKVQTESRLHVVNKEFANVSRELADYKRDLRQASTKKLGELESKLSMAKEVLNDKQKEYKAHMQLFAGFNSWTNEMTQRLGPIAPDEYSKEPATSGEEPFLAKLKMIEVTLGKLQAQTEQKGRVINPSSEGGSPVIGEEYFGRRMSQPLNIVTPILGKYNIRIPTAGDHSPTAKE